MALVTFEDGLNAVAQRKCSAQARDCVDALILANDLGLKVPAIAALHRNVTEEYDGAALGSFVVAILRAFDLCGGTTAPIIAWAAIVGGTAPSPKRAAELHADAYLALDAWVTNWNRRQIRRVA